jgi:hypothetical protein
VQFCTIQRQIKRNGWSILHYPATNKKKRMKY